MKNMKVSKKLFVSFSIVIVLSILLGAVGAFGMHTINLADDRLYEQNVLAISAMGDIRETLQSQRVTTRSLILASGNPQKTQEALTSLGTLEEKMKTLFPLYEATITDPAEESAYYDAKKIYENEYADIKKAIIAASAQSIEAAYAKQSEPEVVTYTNRMVDGFTESMQHNDTWAKDAVDANSALFKKLLIVEAAVLVLAIVVAIVLIARLSGLISKPLTLLTEFMKNAGTTGEIVLRPEDVENIQSFAQVKDEIGQCIGSTAQFVFHLHDLSKSLEALAEGDLTIDLTLLSNKDTMGVALQKMTSNLSNMLNEIHASTTQVSTGSRQIANGAQALAQGSTEQAATVEELSSSISEIALKTKNNSEMAGRAAHLADTIKHNAETGAQQMDQMMEAVKEINQASQSISKVIKVIDDIAFQTNILALNAAVEAARAGQHGKGFAVVAEEVRNLAAKSAEAAKDTGELIANSMQKAELGSRIADETAKSLDEIVSGIKESNELVSDIAQSSVEQSSSITEINQGIDQVTQVIQQNSATAEESAAASEQMSGQATMLESLISQFKIKDGRPGASGMPSPLSVKSFHAASSADLSAPIPPAPSVYQAPASAPVVHEQLSYMPDDDFTADFDKY